MDPLAGIVGTRRNEDIALDLMKFIAATTNVAGISQQYSTGLRTGRGSIPTGTRR